MEVGIEDPLAAIVTSHLAEMKRLGEQDRQNTEESGATMMTSIRETSGVRKQVVDKVLHALGIAQQQPTDAAQPAVTTVP